MSTRTDFAAGLSALRSRADLTVRQLAKIVDTPASTLGAYFSGRHVPPASATPLVRAVLLALDVDPDDVEGWLAALRRARASSDRRLPRPLAPYRGLASFEPADADVFFGRERQTGEIIDRIVELAREPGPSKGMLAVVGPSGAGKSSVLRAGVAAAIGRGVLDSDDAQWTCAVVTPNQFPLDPRTEPGVLVVDQFEEVFTSLDARRRNELLRTISGHTPGTVVVLGMRADFYAEAARLPVLLAALQSAQVLIGPMNPDELRDAIRLPAAEVGVEVEDGLVELVLADLEPRVGHEIGAHDVGTLPLMSHALLAAWDRSDGRRISIADYRATGGLDAAVQRTAEDAFAGLDPAEQDVARAVFLRLVNVEGEVLTTRRRIIAVELDRIGAEDSARRLVTRFVERRLVTAGDGWYEISHEALLSAWPRLREWIDDDRAGLVTHRQLTEAANSWTRAGHDAALLLRGAALDVADAWVGRHGSAVNQLEHRFLESSLALRAAERRAERYRLTRLRALLGVAAALAVVAIVLVAVFVQARNRADQADASERMISRDALSRAAAFEATELAAQDPAIAQQLAIAGYQVAPTPQAEGALIDESTAPIITRIPGQPGPTALAVSGDGRLIAVGHAIDGTVHLYTRGSAPVPQPAGVLPGTTGESIFAMAFAPDGRLLATGGADARVRLWDVSNPDRPTLLSTLRPDVSGAIESLAMSGDGRTLAVGSVGTDELSRWDVSDPSAPVQLPALAGLPPDLIAQSVAFAPTGTAMLVGTSTGTAYLWPDTSDPRTRPRVLETGVTTIDAVAFDPHAARVFTADRLGVLDVWSSSGTPRLVHVLHGKTSGQINVIAVSPDGTLLAAGSSDADLRQWAIGSWAVDADTANPGPVVGAAFTPDGRIITTATDGALRLQLAGAAGIPTSGSTFALDWSADGDRLLVATNGLEGGVQLWDAADPSALAELGPELTMPAPYQPIAGSGALTDDGDLAAGGNAQGRVALWDTSDPSRPQLAGAPFAGDGALVESLAFGPGRSVLAVGGDDDAVHLWDVANPAHPTELSSMKLPGLVLDVAISPDGDLLAVADADDHAYLYDIGDPAQPRELSRMGGFRSYVYGVAFSPNARTLAVADADTTSRLFDIARPRRPHPLGAPLIGSLDYDYSASFTPNGRTVAIASNDGTVRLYAADGSNPLPLETLRAAGSNLFLAAYNPSGTVLAGGGRSDRVTLWSTDVGSYAKQVCRLAGSPISRTEWRLYLPDLPYRPPCS